MLNKMFKQAIFNKKKKPGFTILEVIIAIFVLSVGILGIISFIFQTTSFSSISSHRLIAAYLAQEGIEIVRNIRDTNWLNEENWNNGLDIGDYTADYDDSHLSSFTDRFLNIEENNGFYSYESGTSTIFKRKISIQKPNTEVCPESSCIEVTVEVNWQERGKTYSFPPVKERFYNWWR